MLEKTLESPLDSQEIKPVNPEENQSWIFVGMTMLNLKLQYLGHQLIGKDLDSGKDWRQKKGAAEDEMV